MKSTKEYIDELSNAIDKAKEKGIKSLYRINDSISNNTANQTKHYFESLGYRVEIKKCAACKRTWDVIIIF